MSRKKQKRGKKDWVPKGVSVSSGGSSRISSMGSDLGQPPPLTPKSLEDLCRTHADFT